MKLYIAGPMRGKDFFNFAEFDRVAGVIEELGHVPVSPADLSRNAVRDKGLATGIEGNYGAPNFAIEDFMEKDIRAMRDVDGIVLLDGWENSKGAAVELAYARYRGIPVYASIDEFEYIECVAKKRAA